jgi:putative sterol carrier protein
MPKFGTQEWCDLYKDAINANEAYAEAASWWTGDFVFIVNPSGNLDKKITMWIGLNKGSCTGAVIMNEGDEYIVLEKGKDPSGNPPPPYETEYVYEASYDNWVKILMSELDPIRALLSGQAKVVGDMAKIMRATKAAQELVRTTTLIETEFY